MIEYSKKEEQLIHDCNFIFDDLGVCFIPYTEILTVRVNIITEPNKCAIYEFQNGVFSIIASDFDAATECRITFILERNAALLRGTWEERFKEDSRVIFLCHEMLKLRKALDNLGIAWKDTSYVIPREQLEQSYIAERGINIADLSIYCTRFEYEDKTYTVANGYGTYGGYSLSVGNRGLLEVYCEAWENRRGSLTAAQVLEVIHATETETARDTATQVFN